MSSEGKIIIDSSLDLDSALAQNPANPAPENILKDMALESVEYYGFDGLLHRGQIVMRKDVMEDVLKFFQLAREIKFPIRSAIPVSDPRYHWDDEISCDDNNSSGFNYRLIGGTERLSKHASGLAFDINPVQNIYVRYDKDLQEVFRFPAGGVYSIDTPGTLTAGNPLISLMKNLGWEWGGDWTPESGREDYQHFEKSIV